MIASFMILNMNLQKKKNDIQIDNSSITLNHYQQFKIFYNNILPRLNLSFITM